MQSLRLNRPTSIFIFSTPLASPEKPYFGRTLLWIFRTSFAEVKSRKELKPKPWSHLEQDRAACWGSQDAKRGRFGPWICLYCSWKLFFLYSARSSESIEVMLVEEVLPRTKTKRPDRPILCFPASTPEQSHQAQLLQSNTWILWVAQFLRPECFPNETK